MVDIWILLATVAFFIVCLIAQQAIWMIYSQHLVNKSMSRSFPEYAHGKAEIKKADLKYDIPVKLPDQDEGLDPAEILNQHIQGLTKPVL